MPSWGDLNARLNRLVREGVISGFRTNLATRPDPADLAIIVTPGPAAPPPVGRLAAEEALRARVAAALGGIAADSAIAIEDASSAGSQPGPGPRNSAETLGP
jgi:hypothetical protein